ncbi:tRNA (N(6)-L-threonylcarbamoyladenosine(37)-C(2))-methylthiotransferase MtaB [Desulfuromonas versatilis]|uniref:tRNA (N(6)-L-threonylcarbamoyladenosine(37)-C(2))-methylthiotransferase n=1 Tax=Desulfuromonas versatilis TaxID=2802975 RepID=A0ABM8HXD2_9BACT|nr:tRNA (N(6)-L-threonylcarbamoyladenosine(37)-C(2))-methylthiotransferase MtaB [Desulfuromonas versatilis]BCR05358.1 tRNA (N(6)-L-threonylcarbamoyladenosine(37)-C(2))-methylthiotransferase MtaB [Desulfuromonas versatilis]
MSRTVSIATLGCKTNQFESAAIEERLREAGYQVVPFEEGAELVIVNTCTVTAATDSQSRNLVRRARRLNIDCRVVVTGCYAQVDPQALKAIPGVALVLGNDEKKDFLRYLDEDDEEQRVAVSDIRRSREAVPLSLSSFAERSRAFVQIQNGCDAFCSYCIIPYARGSSRSLSADQVVAQVAGFSDSRYAEVVLTGIHIGRYGEDLEPRSSLVELVRRVQSETDLRRLRLGSIEPTEIPPELIELVAESPILCGHFHVPLQAGDDGVLQRMNRHYTTAFFKGLIDRIHGRMPTAAIGLDVIAGFPGETEGEFENTCRLIESLPVSHLHVFPFSRRPGTPAATMSGQLSGDVVKLRAARLRALGEEKNRLFAERFIGAELEVVVEGGREGGLYRGLSRNYLSVLFAGPEGLEGSLTRVRVREWTLAGLKGQLL